jgi:L-asparaginase II
MRNPILIELTRGVLVESAHAGAFAVVRPTGEVVASVGDIAAPTFPRSAIKPLQAIACVESGAADRFGFGTREIALGSASHSGTQVHVDLARSMLERAGLTFQALGCGVHEPMHAATARELIRSDVAPTALNHNCSGKHAAMLATAVHKGEPTDGYWRPDHPVQVRIARVLEDLTGSRLGPDVRGIDGCSVPNWAIPLSGLAQAFARFVTGEGLGTGHAAACRRIAEACWAHPDLVAGPGRINTAVMALLPGKVFMKSGAEGVYGGALPERGLGFALKIDDGAMRAAEAAAVELISRLYPAARQVGVARSLTNWRGLEVGRVRVAPSLERALEALV